MDTLLLIDANALVHRAYHALPDFKTSDGTPTNAVYGFASVLNKVIKNYQPQYIIACFDAPGKTFRDKMFADYRAQRPKADDNLICQFPIVKEFLEAAGIYYIEKLGFEADDLIAYAVKKITRNNMRSIILTGDKDIYQLVDDKTYILTPQLGYTKEKLFDPQAVLDRFGVKPCFIPDLKALAGDPSDNYKGVIGIGPKIAVKLINKFGAVEEIYKNINKIERNNIKTKLIKDKKNALLSKKLAVLQTKIPIKIKVDEIRYENYHQQLTSFFDKYEFRSLKARFFNNTKRPPIKTVEKKSNQQVSLF